MATVRIIVKKNDLNSFNETQVYIRYGHNQVHCLFGTGIRVTLDQLNWIKRANKSPILDQHYPINSSHGGYTSSNAVIQTKYQEIDELKNTFFTKNQMFPTIHELGKLHDLLKHEDSRTKEDLLPRFSRYIEQRAEQSAKTTIKKFRTTYNHFKEYLEYSEQRFYVSKVTQEMYHDFVNFLFEKQGLGNNSVGAIIKNWRVFLRYLERTGYEFDANLADFKVFNTPADIIALTREELQKLESHDFSKNKSLDQVRDLFVFSCYTGYRYSAIKDLAKQHIVDGQINLNPNKDLEPLLIPLVPQVMRIIEKYHYRLPVISQQKFNEYIKDACEEAGITSYVETLTMKGSNKVRRIMPKYQLMSAKKAINTFITICRKHKMPVEYVALITGKTTKVINKHYFKADNEGLIEAYNRVWVKPLQKGSN